MYKSFFKRFFDIVITSIGMIPLFPIFMVVATILAFTNKGKIVFTQERPGKNGKIFKVIKFKTMTDEKDSSGELLPDYKRLTKLGKLVRSLSLDELPQLINVIKGDMSLIGPRPLRTYYLPLYNNEQIKRHNVRPGITGWAQINGRNAISWTEKFKLDVYYVNNISFLFDLKILLLTIKKVFLREGISKEGNVTTEPFNGHN